MLQIENVTVEELQRVSVAEERLRIEKEVRRCRHRGCQHCRAIERRARFDAGRKVVNGAPA